MDVERPFEEQDLRIADLVEREGRALVLGMNKWDLMEGKPGAAGKLREEADHWLPQVKGVPIVAVSGLHRRGPRPADAGGGRRARGLEPARLDQRAQSLVRRTRSSAHPPPAVSGRRLKLNYITQAKARPPSFVLFCTRADAVPEAYLRYLVNGLREEFDLPGTPIRLTLAREGESVRAAEDTAAMSAHDPKLPTVERDQRRPPQPRRLRLHLHHRAARHAGARHHHPGAAEARARLHRRRHGARAPKCSACSAPPGR